MAVIFLAYKIGWILAQFYDMWLVQRGTDLGRRARISAYMMLMVQDLNK